MRKLLIWEYREKLEWYYSTDAFISLKSKDKIGLTFFVLLFCLILQQKQRINTFDRIKELVIDRVIFFLT